MNIAENNVTEQFQMKDLDNVLNQLKSKKAKDSEGIDRSIFKKYTIGSDLKQSLLDLFNNIKSTKKIPLFMRKASVTTIPKKDPNFY